MADNVDVTPGSGATVAADDVSSVWYQRVKLTDGTADSTTPINVGNGVAANALRVTLASDGTGVVAATQSGTWNVTNVSGTVSLPTGAATSAAQLAAGHTVAPIVGTTGGATPYYNDGVATEASVKGTAGQIYFIHAVNLTATVKWLQLFNGTTGTYVPGTTTPTNEFAIPTQGDTNGAGFVVPIPMGLAYGTAITIFISTAQGGGTAAAANEVNVNIGYA